MKIISNNMTDLEIKQAKTIDELQEQLRLKEFDLSKCREEIRILKSKINLSHSILKKEIKKLKEIDDKRIHDIIITLKSISRKNEEWILYNEW